MRFPEVDKKLHRGVIEGGSRIALYIIFKIYVITGSINRTPTFGGDFVNVLLRNMYYGSEFLDFFYLVGCEAYLLCALGKIPKAIMQLCNTKVGGFLIMLFVSPCSISRPFCITAI